MKIQISRRSITSGIGKERDRSLRFPSRGQQKSNQSRSKNLTNSMRHSCNTQRDEKTPLSDFLQSFRENGAHYISSAYLMSSRDSIHRSVIDGSLFTTLAEDVFTLVQAQLALLDEFLASTNLAMTDTGDAIVADALLSIFRILYCKQIHYGRSSLFLRDVDSCIARANDYWMMGEKTNSMMENISETHYNHLTWKAEKSKRALAEWDIAANLVKQEASNVIDRMNSDAVEASHHVAICVIQIIQQLDIPRELFSRHWEEDLTNNEVAKYIVRVYANYLPDMEHSLVSDYLFHKVVITLARCTICFYLKSFLFKASRLRSSNPWYDGDKKRKEFFRNPRRALMRMTHDIEVFQNFFLTLCEGSAALTKIISNEFSVFRLLFLECSSYAVGQNSPDTLENFIIVIHKRTGANSDITRHFLSDVFILMSERKELNYCVRDSIRNMKDDLDMVKESVGEEKNNDLPAQARSADSTFFQVDEMLKEVYEERILQENTDFCGTLRKTLEM